VVQVTVRDADTEVVAAGQQDRQEKVSCLQDIAIRKLGDYNCFEPLALVRYIATCGVTGCRPIQVIFRFSTVI
jgi:hypothetical protein